LHGEDPNMNEVYDDVLIGPTTRIYRFWTDCAMH